MSDIVERLRNWRTVHLARLHLLMEEAADELERLSRTGTDAAKTGDNAAECHSHGVKCPERERVANHPATPESSTLTEAEREAIEFCIASSERDVRSDIVASARAAVGRLGGER